MPPGRSSASVGMRLARNAVPHDRFLGVEDRGRRTGEGGESIFNWSGILIGLASFIVIGVLHPVVIKCEYYFSDRVWPVFLAGGLAFCAASLLVEHPLLSSVLGVVGFSLLWSIRELKQQTRRVEKGWFPKKPKRAPKG